MILGGLLLRRQPAGRPRRAGLLVLVLGVVGLVTSAAWVVLALYVDAVVR